MKLKVNVTPDTPAKSSKKPVLFTKKYADKIFAYVHNTIEKRINSGRDLNGKAFSPYKTPSKQGEKVDLKETGDMRDSIDYDFSLGKPIVIYYKEAYAKYVDQSRSFIGLTKKEFDDLDSVIDEAVDNFLKELSGRK